MLRCTTNLLILLKSIKIGLTYGACHRGTSMPRWACHDDIYLDMRFHDLTCFFTNFLVIFYNYFYISNIHK